VGDGVGTGNRDIQGLRLAETLDVLISLTRDGVGIVFDPATMRIVNILPQNNNQIQRLLGK
jgi:hypothetical protein